jgi:elongator complex protein 4
MPFQKKPVIIDTAGRRLDRDPTSPSDSGTLAAQNDVLLSPGVRPSPLDGKLTISTGIRSLDSIVAGGHGGLPLGTSLLIEETGTADFGGLLLRYFAAEGLVQGHDIHALGYSEAWKADLPALADRPQLEAIDTDLTPGQEQMKIAWRYERLGQGMKDLPNHSRP